MKGNRNKYIFILIMIFAGSFTDSYSQNRQPKATRQSALEAFSKGNYELAYNQFNELITAYPRDPLYKYYCGVTLVKLERDAVKASELLSQAQQGSAAIRTIPSDGLFYLGRAQQMSGNFEEAIKSFNLYTDQVGRKTAREASTPQFIQQCNEKKGSISASKPIDNEVVNKEVIVPVEVPKVIPDEKTAYKKPDTLVKSEKAFPPGYEEKINEALNYQFIADSLTRLVSSYGKESENAALTDKSALKSKMSEEARLADVNQKLADEKMVEAEKLLKPLTVQPALMEKKMMTDSISVQKKEVGVVRDEKAVIMKDTLMGKSRDVIQKITTQKADSQIIKNTVNQVVTDKQDIVPQPKVDELYSIFEVVAKPVYSVNEKVSIDPHVPPGLIYRIQLGAFSNPVTPSYFKGITPVYGFKSEGSVAVKYYAGMFRKSADASKALVKVKATGFKDAFVVPLMEKKVVSAERAGILEKEWGSKPFATAGEAKLVVAVDTIPPTLVFRVEVIKTVKPLSTEQLDNLRKLAGNRGLEINKNEAGQNIYLIGKFINFESAAEYADLLIRNGQKDAKVAAYIGKKEIPVETAKKLFEKY
jgi:hypothetical protein